VRKLLNRVFPVAAITVFVWISIYAARLASGGAISLEISPPAETGGTAGVKAEPNITRPGELSAKLTGEQEIVEAACKLIEQGRFDAAGELIETSAGSKPQWKLVAELKSIVQQWQKLNKGRHVQREEAYKEQIEKFERLKAGKPVDLTHDRMDDDVNDSNGVKDFNEPNAPAKILVVVARANEFADENQKKMLLSDPCVVGAIEKTKAEAAALEAKGKWLDAYVMDYSWLTAIDPNNKEYSDHAEQLIDKAEIAASFQDSPCETGKQRFDGVKRRIFVRAVDALNFNYISKIDYREMASKGVRRCRLLGEVIGVMASVHAADANAPLLGESFKEFKADVNGIEQLRPALLELEQEIKGWPEGTGKDRFLAVFDKLLELNLATARLPEELVIAQFAESSFSALDPYTVLVWPTYVPDFEKMMTNEFSGIGIEISRQKGQLTVGSLLPDTPAYNSGLDAGDVIESVDGQSTKDMSLQCAVKHITGPAGTKVKLMIRHEGDQQAVEMTLTRAKITVPTIRGWQRDDQGKWQYMVDDKNKIGYVRLTSFSEKTAADLEDSLNALEAAGMKGLIVDLRFNAGGYFDSAVDVADEFLDDGLIVITRPRFGIPTYSAAHSKGTHPNYPLVVLINTGSASASEIVAGALADTSHRRATLVGERTHGKGVVQGITQYPGEGSQLKYTMAYYHLPLGQRVKSKEEAKKEGTSDWGIGPNVTIELRSDELRKMIDIQRDNEVLVKAGHKNGVSPVKRHTIEKTIEVDPQLDTAILVIKTKLIREQAKALAKKAA